MRLDVWLVGFKAGSTPAKSLAGTFGIDLQEALMLEWSVPTIVGRDLDERDAASAVRTLRGIGAQAEARPVDSAAPLGFELPFEHHERLRASTPEPNASKPAVVDPAKEEGPLIPSGRSARVPGVPILAPRVPGAPIAADPRAVVPRVPGAPIAAAPRSVVPREVPSAPNAVGPRADVPREVPSAPNAVGPRADVPRVPGAPIAAAPRSVVPREVPSAPNSVGLRADVPRQAPSLDEFSAAELSADEPSEDALPSLPAPRRPRTRGQVAPGRSEQRPEHSEQRSAPSAGAARAQPSPAKLSPAKPPRAERPVVAQERTRPARKSPQMFDAGPPLELLEVERTAPAPRRPQPSRQPSAPERASSRGITPLLPALGILALGVAATFITLRRGRTAMLGTADLVGHGLDGLALGCLALGLVVGFTALFSDRDHFHLAPGVLALGLAVGAGYMANEWRKPIVGVDAEVGGEASGLITQSRVSLAGFDDEGARALLTQLHDAGAISVRGAAPVRFMGAAAFHALAIELPPGPSSRARIFEVFRTAMLMRGGTASPAPSQTQLVWIVAL